MQGKRNDIPNDKDLYFIACLMITSRLPCYCRFRHNFCHTLSFAKLKLSNVCASGLNCKRAVSCGECVLPTFSDLGHSRIVISNWRRCTTSLPFCFSPLDRVFGTAVKAKCYSTLQMHLQFHYLTGLPCTLRHLTIWQTSQEFRRLFKSNS